jgi:hypothetical protein
LQATFPYLASEQAEKEGVAASHPGVFARTATVAISPMELPGDAGRPRVNPVKTRILALWNRLMLTVEDHEDRSIWPEIEPCKCEACAHKKG